MKNYLLQKLEKKAIQKNIPLFGILELTYRCNLQCQHCYVVRDNRKEWSFSDIKNILYQLRDAQVMFLLFTGGEVLLRDDFFEIIKFANKLKFSFKFFTNGTLLDKTNIEKIANAPPLEVGISVYSHRSSIHDNITKIPGSFEKSIYAIKLLREKNINVKIKCPLMKINFNDFHQIKKLAEELGCEFQYDVNLVPKDNKDKSPLNLRIQEKEIEEVALNTDFNIKKSNTLICGIGKTTFAVSPYGDVYPCLQYKLNCGNLRRKKFSDIWNNSKILKKIREIKEEDIACFTCEDKNYCSRCFGVAYLEDGDFFGKSTAACKLTKILKRKDYNSSGEAILPRTADAAATAGDAR